MLYPGQSFVRLQVNDAGRDFFIGDLHGCVGHLEVLMKAVRFDRACDRLFSVGDLIDHGPDSFGALARLAEWPFFHAILGNHEAMAMSSRGLLRPRGDDRLIWFSNGGLWSDWLAQIEWHFVDEVLSGMPLAMEIPLRDGTRVGMLHAELPRDAPWSAVESLDIRNINLTKAYDRGLETDVIWSRRLARAVRQMRAGPASQYESSLEDEWINQITPAEGIDLLIVGHTITSDRLPIVSGNRWWIDTGAHLKGRLTMVEPLTRRFWQAHWRKDGCGPLKKVSRHVMPLE